jgi:hypothetical protein
MRTERAHERGLGRRSARIAGYEVWRIMVVGCQIRNLITLHNHNNLGWRLLKGDDELSRSPSISGKPVEHLRIGIAVGRFPRGTLSRVAAPVRMGESLGAHMERITLVDVLEWRLGKRKQEGGCYAQIEYATHQ